MIRPNGLHICERFLRGEPLTDLQPRLPAPTPPAIDRLPLLDPDHVPLTRRERVATIVRAVLIAPVAIGAFWLWAVLLMGCR